ncbi:MAG: Cna B-type domain-containing protein, partial [Oscillospiraceae bacterium]|nr:Cna B-type domain-containing protein [Oscillospiraceae bacterium]
YTLDETTGKYKANEEEGAYYPTYVGNAANTDSNVTITNSKQLMLKKVWKNSSNDELSEGKIPVDQITVDIYGVTALGAEEKLFEEIKLERAKDWKLDITDKLEELGNKKLSGYVSFRAEETGLPNEDDYVISCVFNLNENTGDITVTNKSKVATEASVTVNKTWSDGAANHTKDKVLVTLYQSEREIQNISSMTHDELKNALKSAKVMTDAEGNTTGYEDIVLNAANDWSYTWTGLPMDDEGAEGADPNNPVTYYYYVLENMDSVTNNVKYTATYTPIKNGAKTTYTVKNTRTAIVVQKQWFDETGEPIIDIYDEDGNIVANNTDGLPSITLELYKQAADPLLADGCHPNTEGYAAIAKAYFDAIESQYSESKNTELKIVALGDSITHSYNTGTPYPEQLTTLLTNASYQLAGGNVTNKGNSGEQVGNSDTDGFRGRISRDIPSDTNIVLLLGGTNDIHQSGSGQANPNECMRRLQACIEEIQAHVPNATIFVGSIPHFDFYKNGAITEGGRWWPSQYQENDGKEANGLIDNYNAQIEAYAESANNVYYVDTCTAVDGKEYVVDKNGNRISVSLKKGNNWTAVVDVPDDGEYYIEEINVPDGWTVTYSGQGLKPGTATPIIAMNTKEKTPKTEISVVKNWVGDSADTSKRDGISLALMCSVDGTNWEEVAVDMPTPTKDGNTWTYTYENLPVTNNAGKTYSYKVEEAEMEGYKVQYDTPDIWQASKTETGTLTLTNTRQLALTLKKDWVGVDDPQGSISVNIYRSTNPADVPSDAELILKVPSTVSVGVNKDATVSANKTIASATSKDENIATVTFDDKTIIIHGNAEGTTTITVTDENDNTAEIKVTVSDMSLTISPSAIVLGTNETATLSIEKNIGNVTYSASSSDVSIDGNTVTVTGRNKGVVTITATDESGNTASVNLEIKLPNNFEIIGIDTIAPGDKVQLEVNPNYGSFKWSSSNSNIAEVDEITGEITGKAEGTATITAVRDDKLENYFTIKVENATPLHTLNAGEHFDITTNKAINSISFKLEGSTGYIDLYITSSDWSYQHGTVYYDGNVIENYQFTENYISASINGNIVTYDLSRTGKTSWGVYNNNDKSHVEELKERTSTIYVYSYTINYADGTSETFKVSSDPAKLSLQNVTTFYAFANGTEPEGANNDTELVKSVDITATTGWKTVVEDLDVYDAEGNLYYYWVVEESHVGFDVSYLFEDGDNTTIYAINATNPGDGAITIRNTKIESHEISMPSTGGPGVGRSHTVGAILMCGSTASYILARRRRNRRKRA